MQPISVMWRTEKGIGGAVEFDGFAVTVKRGGRIFSQQIVKLTEDRARECFGNMPTIWTVFEKAKAHKYTTFYVEQ